MQGHGVKKFVNGDIYEGEFSNGKEWGIGKHRCTNGASYEGEWKDGIRSGKGI
jgi:hypothetical protein